MAPTGHIFHRQGFSQTLCKVPVSWAAESKGIEPSGLHLAQLSRLLADRSALPSMLTSRCALTPNLRLSLLDKDSNLNPVVQSHMTYR